MSSADKALIPEGYVMKDKEPTIIGDASAIYPGKGWTTGVAVPGTMTRYNYNGSVVQYELVPKAVLQWARAYNGTLADRFGGGIPADAAD